MVTLFLGIVCTFIGYILGMIGGEIRVKTFWGGFITAGVTLTIALLCSSALSSIWPTA